MTKSKEAYHDPSFQQNVVLRLARGNGEEGRAPMSRWEHVRVVVSTRVKQAAWIRQPFPGRGTGHAKRRLSHVRVSQHQ
jgi:hypothetical protein